MDDAFRALTARVMTQGLVVEELLFMQMLSMTEGGRAAVIGALRRTAAQIGQPDTLSDPATEFLADVQVRSQAALEALLVRVDSMLRQVPAHDQTRISFY